MDTTIESLPRYLTTREVAALASIAEQTLVNWRCSRREGPPFVKLGGSVRYPREAVERWLSAHTVDPCAK